MIGAAVVDVLAGIVDKEIFEKGSVPSKHIRMSCGGDALNESVVLSGLGINAELISVLGEDDAGQRVLECLRNNHVSTDKIAICDDLSTSINIVLVDENGERFFITDAKSSLRKLSKDHILKHCESMGDIVSFASIFVSPLLGVPEMLEVFSEIKKTSDRVLVADMTTAKKGERIGDIAPLFEYIDYIIPNAKEAEILTGESDPERAADTFIQHGTKAVIIKCGKDGCIYKTKDEKGSASAYKTRAVDTTGAGDGFVAGFIYGLSKGCKLSDCCRYGNATASLMVEQYGTQGIIKSSEQVLERY